VLWDQLLLQGLAQDPPRQVLIAGGSDAHGDFNYSTYLSLPSYATDNAIGKVQTVVRVPGGYGAGNLPPIADIMAALRAGRSVVTDGPFVEIGLDLDGDGDWYEAGDLAIGDDGAANPLQTLPLALRWASLPEFGQIVALELLAGNADGTVVLTSFDPSSTGQGLEGETTFDLGGLGLSGAYYLRAECLTADGDAGHRAYTNPIWIDFDETVSVTEQEDADHRSGGGIDAIRLMQNVPNPFNPATVIPFSLPGPGSARLTIFDSHGRQVRALLDGARLDGGQHRLTWDGRDQRGQLVPAGVYFYELRAAGQCVAQSLLLLP